MDFYGLQKMTLIDYPEKIACVAFTHGCNFRCPFCHNPELVIKKPNPKEQISEDSLLQFLEKRIGKLEGIVFTGGEPLLYAAELESLLKKIKKLGFAIKLDTNGTNPDALKSILDQNLIDYIAMDLKSSIDKYPLMGASQQQIEDVIQSLKIIKKADIKKELRTTVVPGIHDEQELNNMIPLIKGIDKYTIQNFIPSEMIDPEYTQKQSFPSSVLEKFKKIVSSVVENVEIKNKI